MGKDNITEKKITISSYIFAQSTEVFRKKVDNLQDDVGKKKWLDFIILLDLLKLYLFPDDL